MKQNFVKSACKSYETIAGYGSRQAVSSLSVEDGILDINELDTLFVESEHDFLEVFLKEARFVH